MHTRPIDRLDDAGSDIGSPDRLKQRLATDGVALLKGILPTDVVQGVTDELVGALRSTGWLSPDTGLQPQVPARTAYDREWWPTYRAAYSLESIHRLSHEPALWSVVASLFDEPIFNHPAKVVRLGFPDSAGGEPTEPHQDYSLLHATPDLLTCWIPLVPCPEAKGGLQILRGSQNGGLRPSGGQAGAQAIFLDIAADDPAWATADYEVGDVLLFHSLTVHAALPNRTNEMRLSIDTRYQSVADKVRPAVLAVHGAQQMPSWEEITRDWSTSRWIEVPDEVERELNPFGAMPISEQMEKLRIPPSRFVTVPSASSA